MGASLGGGSGGSGGGNSRRRRKSGFSEINVTPMVDVMLVLLIIFMVTAPMLTAGVQVDLPKTQSSPLQGQDEPLTVTIQRNHKVYIQKELIPVGSLGAKLKAVAGEKMDTRIFVRGDKDVDYGSIMQVVGEVNAAGFGKVALITEQTQENASAKKDNAMHFSMSKGQYYSLGVHVALLVIMIFGLPDFLHRRLDEQPVVISVDILPIAPISNVKPHEKMTPVQEKKPVAEQKTAKKATQEAHKEEAKAAEEKPIKVSAKDMVKPEEKAPVVKPKEIEKPKEKKAEKKPDKKSKEPDLDSILKSVSAMEKAEESKHPTEKAVKDPDKNEAKSETYDASQQLSMSEIDAIKQQLQQCWNPPSGMKDTGNLAALLHITLTKDGAVTDVKLAKGESRYSSDASFQAVVDSAKRAVRKCSPFKNLPADKYTRWGDMELNFDPKDFL